MRKLAFVLALLASPATAMQCAPREAILEQLRTDYKEARQVLALTADGHILELYANVIAGTWTVLTTSADGVACIRASGIGIEITPEVLEPAKLPI